MKNKNIKFNNYPDVLTVKQAAELLSVGTYSIYKLVKEEKLVAKQVGNKLRISKKSIIYYVEGAGLIYAA
jgi:excisionase family DNA binding protein